MGTVSDLRLAAQWVADAAARGNTAAFMGQYQALRSASEAVGKAWSGSWLPRFANMYDRNLLPVPMRLRAQAGGGSTDSLPPALQIRCREWLPQEIRETIFARADQPGDGDLRDHAIVATGLLDNALAKCMAPLSRAAAENVADPALAGFVQDAQQVSVADDLSVLQAWRPSYSRLRATAGRGFDAPPEHLRVLAALEALASPFEGLRRLAQLTRAAADHLDRLAVPCIPVSGLVMATAAGLLPSRQLGHASCQLAV